MRGTKCEKNTYERYKRSFVTWQCLCRGHCSFFPRTLYSLQERKLSLLLMCFVFKFFSTANYLCIDFHLILRFQKAMICVSISTSALCTGNHDLHELEFQDTVTQFGLRGLCASSTLDTVYKVRQDLSQVLMFCRCFALA